MFWKKKGIEAFKGKDHDKAEQMLQLSLKFAPTILRDAKCECYKYLSDIYFGRKDFSKCLESGRKHFKEKSEKSEVGIEEPKTTGYLICILKKMYIGF